MGNNQSNLIIPSNTLAVPASETTQNLATSNLKLSKKLIESVKYNAHLSKMLYEACSILEKLDVTVDVSEPLACWWEREKRRTEKGNSAYAKIFEGHAHLRPEHGSGVGVGSGGKDHPAETRAVPSPAGLEPATPAERPSEVEDGSH